VEAKREREKLRKLPRMPLEFETTEDAIGRGASQHGLAHVMGLREEIFPHC